MTSFVDQLKDAMNDAGANQWETVAAFAEVYATVGHDAVDDEYLNKYKSTSTRRREAWDKIKVAMDTYAMKKNQSRARDDDEATPVGSVAKRTRVD